MFLKPSVSFLLLLCFVSCNLATPTASRIRRDVSEESLLPKNVEQSMKELTKEIEKSIKTVTQNYEWIYNNVIAIVRNTFQEGVQSVASWVVDFMVRMELFTMADGWRLFFPVHGKAEIEQEYRAVAIAVSKLMMNLKTMERADVVVKNVSRHLVAKDVEPHLKDLRAAPEKMLRTFFHMYIETLDHQMAADEELRAEYKQWKTKAKEIVKQDPKMHETPFKVWEKQSRQPIGEDFMNFVKDKTTLRQAVVNKMFMQQSVKHFKMIFSEQHHQRYLLARALIQKARSSSSDSKINEVYHQALRRAADLPIDEEDDNVATIFFKSIENALESQPTATLNTEIRAMMKQIEGSTVYDTDMFYIDFSLL